MIVGYDGTAVTTITVTLTMIVML